LPRANLVNRILDAAFANPLVVIQSPPATGKTYLLLLMERALEKEGIPFRHLNVPGKTRQKDGMKKFILESLQWPDRTVIGGQYIRAGFLFLDDMEHAYADDKMNDEEKERVDDNWQFLTKTLPMLAPRIRIVVAARHTVRTPGTFASLRQFSSFSFADLKLRERAPSLASAKKDEWEEDESEDYWTRFAKEYGGVCEWAHDADFKTRVVADCGGHIGCLCMVLDTLRTCKIDTVEDGWSFYLSVRLPESDVRGRCVAMGHADLELSADQRVFLQRLMVGVPQDAREDSDLVRSLIRAGVVTELEATKDGERSSLATIQASLSTSSSTAASLPTASSASSDGGLRPYGFTCPLLARCLVRWVFPRDNPK